MFPTCFRWRPCEARFWTRDRPHRVVAHGGPPDDSAHPVCAAQMFIADGHLVAMRADGLRSIVESPRRWAFRSEIPQCRDRVRFDAGEPPRSSFNVCAACMHSRPRRRANPMFARLPTTGRSARGVVFGRPVMAPTCSSRRSLLPGNFDP